ncbi:STAS domain-containing protein [Nocardioides abyssi]|uniref:STAS domain-containing protein n=1 Tax=Nocardioides abyssi TaxID=3058370 RepID=A0ABT8EXL2_9ACTN|nr:STAS domain-containing protein [Nocardioides abyssi]MDN4162890.1 STAS domain-containing protein [Nocardioides abyssi]
MTLANLPTAPVLTSSSVRLLVGEQHAVLHVAGELDLAVRDRLEQVRRRALGLAPAALVVDLGDVAFLDCASARVVLSLLETAAGGGARTTLVCPDGPVLRVLELVAGCSSGGGATARLRRTALRCTTLLVTRVAPAPGRAAS